MRETDPANLQPKVRPLNRKVADFIRENTPPERDQSSIFKALDILESPWPLRDEGRLRSWFDEEMIGKAKADYLVGQILESGLEPFKSPEALPPIQLSDIELVVWLAVSSGE